MVLNNGHQGHLRFELIAIRSVRNRQSVEVVSLNLSSKVSPRFFSKISNLMHDFMQDFICSDFKIGLLDSKVTY